MEKHIEMSLTKKLSFSEHVVCILMSILPMLVSCYVLVLVTSLKYNSFLPLAIVLCAVSLYLSYKIYCSYNVDWEYIFIDDELRFTKIINKSRRRELLTVSLSKAEAVARVTDGAHNQFMKNPGYRKYNFKTNTSDDVWFVAGVDAHGSRVCVAFEPDERMLEAIRLTVRQRFFA